MSANGPTRSALLSLYRQLLRHGKGFADPNLRHYVARKVRASFADNLALSDAAQAAAYSRGLADLQVVRRQAALSAMYAPEPNVLERQQQQYQA